MPITEIVIHSERATNGQGVTIPRSAHTLAGFRAWAKSDAFPERGHFAYIGGKLYVDLTMEELETHNKVKGEISRVVGNVNSEEELGELYVDGVLVSNVEADVSNEPDALFALWTTLECGRARAVPREGHEEQYMEIEGSPDWALEIVSASSVVKDTRWLRERYHRAGIAEYWLVDARGDAIDFQILLHKESGYAAAKRRNGWQYSEVFRRWFRLTRRRGRMNYWRYTLQVKK